jgi:hypothetical protein
MTSRPSVWIHRQVRAAVRGSGSEVAATIVIGRPFLVDVDKVARQADVRIGLRSVLPVIPTP